MDCSTPGFAVHHQLLELAQSHVHRVGDLILCRPLRLLPSVLPSIRFLSNESVLPNLIYRFNTVLIKTLASYFIDICKLILNFKWRDKRTDSVQFSSVAKLCPTLCDPVNRSTPGLPVHHHLPEFTETHIHRVRDAIQPSHPLSSPSPAPNPSQHQSLFQ